MHPFTTITPVVLVIGFSIVKEGIEDFRRYVADKDMNHRTVLRWDGAGWSPIFWKEVRPGDVLKVLRGETFPCGKNDNHADFLGAVWPDLEDASEFGNYYVSKFVAQGLPRRDAVGCGDSECRQMRRPRSRRARWLAGWRHRQARS